MKTTKTTCAYCGVGCGVLATKHDDGTVSIKGDPDHPANFGRLCSKGMALGETLGDEERLLYPIVQGQRSSWKDATDLVAEKFKNAIANHGPDSVAFYVSGQLLTEDYYVANKLMKGFIGSANIDTNSRLCMSSAVAGHKRAFGADIVPCSYSDLKNADLIVLVGSNLAWCHPVLFHRILAERAKRDLKLVVIDPRRTVTAESADLHLAIQAGSDVALFNGLLAELYRRGEFDSRFVFAHTSGLTETLLAATPCTVKHVAEVTKLNVHQVQQFYDLFANTAKTVTAFSMGVNQSTSGTDKVNAIINCHLLTGRIGVAGAGPFSITGQPNAMGGREVGGLANMLAAHMDIENPVHRNAVQKFWASPGMATKPGLKAVELFQAVKAEKIKALWIMATNPAVSMPDSEFIAAALKACPFIVVSDVTTNTETAKYAHVLLPAQGWGEKDGMVTNSERRMSRQRGFLIPVGEARTDWKIISDVAIAMGFAGFSYGSPAEIFQEFARLTQIENYGTRKFDLNDLLQVNYDLFAPYQWGGEQPFADKKFQTPDGKARFIPTLAMPLAASPNDNQTFILNTGRVRDQWHTMTRTGLVPKLFGHRGEPYLEISSQDAVAQGLRSADLAEISGLHGNSVARVLISDSVLPCTVFQPMHWSSAFASQGIANAASIADVDPISGQPALKSSLVAIKKYQAAWYGCGIAFGLQDLKFDYWAKLPLTVGSFFECAGKEIPGDWTTFVRDHFGIGSTEVTFVQGRESAYFRCAEQTDGKISFAFFVSKNPVEVSRSWLQMQLGTEIDVLQLLAGRPSRGKPDAGPIICACNGVGQNQIYAAVNAKPSADLNTICEMTNAGMGCGSCRPEVQRIIHETAKPRIAAE